MGDSMAKKTKVSGQEARNLRSALCYAKYQSPGVLARLLIEAFLYEDGDITADWFVRERACTKGSFSKLRERLVHDGWLHFREDTKRYFPGVRLKSHLEAVKETKAVTFADIERKADKEELANLDARKVDRIEFAKVADDVQDLKAQMHEIHEILAKLKRLQAPPPSIEAQEQSAKLTDRLGVLLSKTKLQ
jgi:hypothetical protein